MKISKEAILLPDTGHKTETPLFDTPIAAGFPSPADNFSERALDLNKYLIKHPAATFFVKVQGSSMEDANIFEGDILIIDRSIKATDKSIIIAAVNGEFTVKRIKIDKTGITLLAEIKNFSPIKITPETDFEIWGVVTYIIHKAM